MTVGHVLPAGVVIVGLAGKHDTVIPAQDRQGIPHVVAINRDPLPAKMFSRALGSASPTSTTVSPSASSPRSKMSAANTALSTTDSARDDGGSTDRSTMPLCESNQRPSVNGATADGSTGMPTDADRTAATTHPLLSAGATEAKDASPHIGAALRQRRGVDPVPPPSRCAPAPGIEETDSPPVGVHQPVLLPTGRI